MSSATRINPEGVRAMLSGMSDRLFKPDGRQEAAANTMARIARLGMSPRQQLLNTLWAWYRCEHYTARKLDWYGREITDPIETEAIASQGFLPAGFYDAGESLPIKFRRPTAPYALVKVIVDRFTGLLFSERHHPQIRAEGDTNTEGYMNALAETARLWPSMILARTYGGSTGTVCGGFQFIDGVPIVEIHDPRWVQPKFADRATFKLSSIEKRYMYFQDELDPTGLYVSVPYWYRRVIDAKSDILYAPAPVDNGEEPDWQVDKQVDHNLGFCPVVWAQNLPVQDDIDGDPDCLGAYDLIEAIDALLAQANKGVISNCDPTAVVSDDGEMSELRKGSDNMIKLSKGGAANYMEINGSGPESALKLASELRKFALEVTQCVLEHPDRQNTTATEIERVYSSMIAKADVLREQYGEKFVKPLLEMMVKAVRTFGAGVLNEETGTIEKQTVLLPPRKNGNGEMKPPEMGAGGVIKLQWPAYFDPVLTDVEMASRAAIAAKTGGLIDAEHASTFVAEYFKVENVQAMLAKVKSEQTQAMQQQEEAALKSLTGPFGRLE